jgi:hypothetical protein
MLNKRSRIAKRNGIIGQTRKTKQQKRVREANRKSSKRSA